MASPAGLRTADLNNLPAVVDVVTAAAVLGIGRTVAYELVRTGRWPTRVLALGKRRLVPTAELIALVIPQVVPSASPGERGPLSGVDAAALAVALDELRDACDRLNGVLTGSIRVTTTDGAAEPTAHP